MRGQNRNIFSSYHPIIMNNSKIYKYLERSGKKESACKPGSVENSHSSRLQVTLQLKQSTREPRGPRVCSSIWSCSGWGLPCHFCYQLRGALLPHLFTLTQPLNHLATIIHYPYDLMALNIQGLGGIFSAALSVGSRPPGVTWHPAQWSPDFPPFYRGDKTATAQPTLSLISILYSSSQRHSRKY